MIRVATLSLTRFRGVLCGGVPVEAPRGRRAFFDVHAMVADALVIGAALLAAAVLGPAVCGALAPIGPAGVPSSVALDPANLPAYAARSVLRMLVGLVCSLVFALVYGLACARSRLLRAVLLPALDVLQSVPVLGFLSASVTMWLALFPGCMLGVEAAGVFAIFTSQAWNMALSFYQALAAEPAELDEMARSFRLTRWQRFWRVDVPFGVQPLIWNAMMSMGGAWFFLGASELISVNGGTMALPGLGSYAALAAAAGRADLVARSVAAMALVIVGMDVLLWRPLQAWAERFCAGEGAGRDAARRSTVLEVLRASRVCSAVAASARIVAAVLDALMGPLFGRTGDPLPRWRAAAGRFLRRLGRLRAVRAAGVLGAAVLALGIAAGSREALAPAIGALPTGEVATSLALGAITFLRVIAVTLACSLIWVPAGVVIGRSPRIMRVAQPIIQMIASFPASFLFPVIVAGLAAAGIGLGAGSLLLMALGTQWYILFNVLAGAAAIPGELLELADIARMPRRQRWTRLYLPAVAGPWVAGALAAAGGAWNASVVAEVVEVGEHAVATPGLGSYIAAATTSGDAARSVLGIAVMCAFVILANCLVWKPLQRIAASKYAL